MDLHASIHPTPAAWLVNSTLAPHLDALAAYLSHGRYASSTAKRYLASVAHFARWLAQCGVPVQRLDERKIQEFLNEHLPGCDCPAPVIRDHRDIRAALGHLLIVLRKKGVIAEPRPLTGHIATELRRYDCYLCDARGLTARTRSGRLRTARRLLLHKFGARPVVTTALRPADLRRFMAQQLGLLGTTSNAITLAAGLRAYLRYRTTRGDRVHGLLGAIASPAQWSLATLPRALKAAEVEQLLASFTASLRWPRRGYAMVRCALDMGLRISEVAKLQLADIDWRTGTVTLHRTKSRRQDMLPLPAVTGRALADYVRHERPKTSNPAVFVRCLAPRDQPIGVDAVRRVIRDAYQRIGLTHGRAHALRHTLACRLLKHGSSLKEVADVLRHRSLNTTLIYAKLDHPRLAAVALPWPGSTP